MLAQLAVGMVLNKVAQKWGGKDLVPYTQAEAPETAQLGGTQPNYVRRNREALTIKKNTDSYNPMNM